MSSLIDNVIDHRNYLQKLLEAAKHQGFLDGYYYDDDNECWVKEEK
jgi:hypothetical protein